MPDTSDATPPVPPERATADSLPGSRDEVRQYIAAVMRQLNKHKTYPRELKKAKTEGTVTLQFTIDRNGRLVASGVKQSSGHPELDRAAMEMLARADPLPAIPEFMNRNELALAIPVEYSLITDR
jgi:protein TonB